MIKRCISVIMFLLYVFVLILSFATWSLDHKIAVKPRDLTYIKQSLFTID